MTERPGFQGARAERVVLDEIDEIDDLGEVFNFGEIFKPRFCACGSEAGHYGSELCAPRFASRGASLITALAQGPPLTPALLQQEIRQLRMQQEIRNPTPDNPLSNVLKEAVEKHGVTPTMPPHAGYGALGMRPRAGDMVVITGGEQRGWRGRVPHDYDDMPSSIPLVMNRPDGSTVLVTHRIEYIAKVLAPVPSFDSQEDAEAWLTANDRELRPAFVPGEIVRVKYSRGAAGLGRDFEAKVLGHHQTRLPDKLGDRLGSGALVVLCYTVLTMELPDKIGEPCIFTVTADWIESPVRGSD